MRRIASHIVSYVTLRCHSGKALLFCSCRIKNCFGVAIFSNFVPVKLKVVLTLLIFVARSDKIVLTIRVLLTLALFNYDLVCSFHTCIILYQRHLQCQY